MRTLEAPAAPAPHPLANVKVGTHFNGNGGHGYILLKTFTDSDGFHSAYVQVFRSYAGYTGQVKDMDAEALAQLPARAKRTPKRLYSRLLAGIGIALAQA